jgi:hypothetical protein
MQRLSLPPGLNTAAQPRLSRRPPLATMLTSEHHPPPALDDMAERPQIPGRPDHVQRLVQILLEPSPVGARQAARTNSTRPDSSGPIAGSAPLTPWFLASRPVFRSGVCQSLLRRACMPSSLPLGTASIERLAYRSRWAASSTVIPPE